jgi:nitroimidazol reductase NimA-like FMN-containing flavoprotein (pyridoxamine 5'-phosphate oxidase superfamily)
MRIKGPWPVERIHEHLASAVIPLRLAYASASSHPQLLSLWFVWRDDAFWCATSTSARVVALLAREPRCGFEVAPDAPPYHGVRGRGVATLDPARGAETLELLVDRYLRTRESPFARWLLARAASEVAIRIEPSSLVSWDFSARMNAR